MIERRRQGSAWVLRIGRDDSAGTALNRMVYNRELGAVLISGTVALVLYGLVLREFVGGSIGLVGLVAVFGAVFWLVRRFMFRERATVITLDREGGTVTVLKTAFLRDTRSECSLDDWGYVRVDEIAPRNTDDLKEIYRWQEMAEPGVHAKPVPLYRVVVVGRDGKDQIIVHEGQDMAEALEVKRVLTEMRAAVAEAA